MTTTDQPKKGNVRLTLDRQTKEWVVRGRGVEARYRDYATAEQVALKRAGMTLTSAANGRGTTRAFST